MLLPRPPASDHAALVHQLGGEAWVLPVPSAHDGLLEVGRLHGLCWLSGEGTRADAQRTARRLARSGELVLIAIDHPDSDARYLTVTLDPIRITCVPKTEGNALALRRLARVATGEAAPPLAIALQCAEALDVDAAGRTTFAAMRILLDEGIDALPARLGNPVRHAWVLLQLTRLLFLRFVESEGWLNGESCFLADRLDHCFHSRRDPHRHLLAPLFFGTLNRPLARRSRLARSFGRVPFLNGGLFEPHALERRYQLQLPTEFWRRTTEQLLVRTEVTLLEDALDGRVTPEMLGRVFEGLMEPAERKRDGAFYTPPALVNAIVREALAVHLGARLGRDTVETASCLDDPDPALLHAMSQTTILDPAVGSGAFLVGALRFLHGPGQPDGRRTRHLVTRCLHGVDRNPTAVRMTELRLWLEVLRASRGAAVSAIRPLPNLDATIRAGDALLDLELGQLGVPVARRLRLAQARFSSAHGGDKRDRLRALQRAEIAALHAGIADRLTITEDQIRELVAGARAPTLFGDVIPISRVDRVQLRHLHDQRKALRREQRRLETGGSNAPFAMAAAFAPILTDRGGFDMVVGNPPWVRAERLPAATRDALAARYRWWRPTRGRGYVHLPDLSVAFVERSVSLLAPDGTVALLLPSKLATAGYASAMRAGLASRTTLSVVADLTSDPRADFDATTYPLALIASRTTPTALHEVRTGLAHDANRHRQQAWTASGVWRLTTPAAHDVAARLAAETPTLSSAFAPQLGVKTGANVAFLNPPEALSPWCRPAVRGRDVRAFTVDPVSRILWPADANGNPWKSLPQPVAEHLRAFQGQLERRADYHDGPWWQLFRVRAATASHRVVWGDLAHGLEAAVLMQPACVPLNSCYVIATPTVASAHAVAAWLNSTWIRALARISAEPAAGGTARFGARAVGGVPFRQAALTHPVLLAPPSALTPDAQDDAVADILSLTPHDRSVLAPLATRRR